LTLNKTGTVLNTGWTATGTVGTGGYRSTAVSLQWVKTFTGNTTETVIFQDLASNQGDLVLYIDRIDTTAPLATFVSYSPATATNGDVTVTLVTDTPIQTPNGRTSLSQTTFTKTFVDNT
jgi:hypothetical protein